MAENKTLIYRLVTQGGIYALGNVAIKASGFILAPILTNKQYLAVESYGELSLMLITGLLATGVFSLGMPVALVRYMTNENADVDKSALAATALFATALGGLVISCIVWVLAPQLTTVFFETSTDPFLIRLFTIYILFKVIGAVPYVMMRIKERAGIFVAATLLELTLLVGCTYYLLVGQGMGLSGVIWAYVLSAGAASLLLVAALFTRIRIRFSSRLFSTLLRFGVPLALGGLAMPVLRAGDQYVLKFLEGSAVVAQYAWGTRISSILNMLFLNSFSLAFSVLGMKALGKNGLNRIFYRKTLRGYTIVGGLAVLAVSVLAYDLTALVTRSPEYQNAVPLVLPLSLGALTYGYYVIFVNFLYNTNKTPAIMACTFAAAGVNIGLNLALIPALGMLGAATATLLSYVALTVAVVLISRSGGAIDMPWWVLARVLALIGILYFFGSLVPTSGLGGSIVRATIVASYLPLLIVLQLTSWSELMSLWETALAKMRDVI